jgi:signal-transduction protein with cAMP-binding, CBS, and nucleotidyltransferase domain
MVHTEPLAVGLAPPSRGVTVKARDVMAKRPVTVPAYCTIQQAAVAMGRAAVGAVVIVDEDRQPLGIVTNRDLVVRALARGLPPDARVDDVMSAGVVCVDGDAELSQVTAILSSHPFRRVPVVDHDRMVGMVTLDDLVVRLAEELHGITRRVAAQLMFSVPELQHPVKVA